jgi:hypothetical protein
MAANQDSSKSSIWQSWTSKTLIVIMAIYLVLLTVAVVVSIIQIWPPSTGESADKDQFPILFWNNVELTSEAHLVLLVVLAAVAGSQAFVIRSFSWYVGQRKLKNSWILYYLLMPLIGITVALAFYFVIRGGFLSSESSSQNLSPIGFVAMGLLVGMFTDSAVEKLKSVAEAFFEKKKQGDDADKSTSPPQTT